MQSNELKKSLLELLEKDPEFRYAVAGYIGLEDIRSSVRRLEESVARLIEAQARNEERFARIEEELRDLRQETNSLREVTNRLVEETNSLREVTNRLVEETNRLSKDVRIMQRDIRDIRSYMDKLSLTFEDEAREVISYMLREKGIFIGRVDRLILPDTEIDIYGTDTDTCIVGEASVRIGVNVLEEITDKIDELCKRYPEYLRNKIIMAVYTMYATPDAVASARSKGIWLVTPTRELTELRMRAKEEG